MKSNPQNILARLFLPVTILLVGILFIVILLFIHSGETIQRVFFLDFRYELTAILAAVLPIWVLMLVRYSQLSGAGRSESTVSKQLADANTRKALQEIEERFKLLVENAPVGIMTYDTAGRIIDVNSKLLEILGSPSAELTRQINVLTFPQMVEMGISGDLASCLNTDESVVHERAYVTKWGKSLVLRYNVTPLKDSNDQIIGALAIMEDFSDHKEAEQELQNLYNQIRKDADTKAVLLEEVTHRVKNNLAGIIGMLYATRRFIKKSNSEQDYLVSIDNLIRRIEGMATVHEMLTESGWSALPVSELTHRLINNNLQALPNDKGISADIQAEEDILVSPKQAGNLGMVINELITNTIKHTLNEQDTARITVRISRSGEEVVYLYQNDGPGFPDDVLTLKNVGTGIYIVETIVKNGLGGTLKLQNTKGAEILIRFKPLTEKAK